MTDISTKAIIERCDHIDHCSLNTHHQDALRMRALVDDRDRLRRECDSLVKLAEETARVSGSQDEEVQMLQQKLDQMQLACVEVGQLARNTALVEAAEKIAGQNHVDSELRRGRLQAPGVLTRAFEAILSLRSGPLDDCPECSGSGMRDSGGVQPWGDHIDVPCDCGNAPRPKSKAVPSTAAVEVCGICDIAGCHHTRELNEKMPNEIAAWPTFPDGCVTGSWSANQHHQDAVAYVRKEPAPRHLDVSIMPMKLSGGRVEYYTRISCNGRTYDVRRYPEEYLNRAEYERDELRHVLLGEDKPNLMDDKYSDKEPAAPAPHHSDDAAVDRFAAVMKAKLAAKRADGRGGWDDKTQCRQQFLSDLLRGHVDKGDPVDVANFAMMLHQRGEVIAPVQEIETAPITFMYTNWRGETAQRTAVPKRIWFGSTDWHPEPGWLMTAHDLEKAADRDFALADCAFAAPGQSVQEAAVLLLDVWEREGLEAVGARLRALAQEGRGDE